MHVSGRDRAECGSVRRRGRAETIRVSDATVARQHCNARTRRLQVATKSRPIDRRLLFTLERTEPMRSRSICLHVESLPSAKAETMRRCIRLQMDFSRRGIELRLHVKE